MATAQPGPEVLDIGNQLLAPGPSLLNVTTATMPGGSKILIATIRTDSATLTVWLTRPEAETWRDALDAKITKMGTLLAPRGNGHPA